MVGVSQVPRAKVRLRVLGALMVTLTLCAVGAAACDDRTVPDAPLVGSSGGPGAREPVSPAADGSVRRADVPISPDFKLRNVAFADSSTGYAVFSRCATASAPASASAQPGSPPTAQPAGSGCRATLLATFDAGNSWLDRRLPFSSADYVTLRPQPDGRLLVGAEPHGWYLSTDRGRTFVAQPAAPSDPDVGTGGYTILCSAAEGTGCPARLGRTGADGVVRPVPIQPELPGQLTHVTGAPGDRLVVSSVRAGRLYVAVSRDGGAHWYRLDPPGQSVPVRSGVLLAARDGSDVWLAGVPDTGAFPVLWRLDQAGTWHPASAAGHPDGTALLTPVGGGELIASVDGDFGMVVDGGTTWRRSVGPVAVAAMRVLSDGAVQATDAAGSTVWLCRCQGGDRTWVRIAIVPTG